MHQSNIMKAEKRVAESEEISVGERDPEQEDMEDFYEVRCTERAWKQNLKELNWDSYKKSMKNTHGEIKKGEDGMGALSLRPPN